MSSFGYSVLGFGTVATTAAVSVSAPSGARVEDASGTNGQVSYTESGGGSGQIGAMGLPLVGMEGNTVSISAYGDTTGGGTPTSWQWAITVNDNSAGLVTSSTPTPPSTQNWTGANFTINGRPSFGDGAEYELQVTATNSGGSSVATFTLNLIFL
tara:strand:- start:838 stop:1302 length:465 start_codon:yes stop_codon:yes gene_type:complete